MASPTSGPRDLRGLFLLASTSLVAPPPSYLTLQTQLSRRDFRAVSASWLCRISTRLCHLLRRRNASLSASEAGAARRTHPRPRRPWKPALPWSRGAGPCGPAAALSRTASQDTIRRPSPSSASVSGMRTTPACQEHARAAGLPPSGAPPPQPRGCGGHVPVCERLQPRRLTSSCNPNRRKHARASRDSGLCVPGWRAEESEAAPGSRVWAPRPPPLGSGLRTVPPAPASGGTPLSGRPGGAQAADPRFWEWLSSPEGWRHFLPSAR